MIHVCCDSKVTATVKAYVCGSRLCYSEELCTWHGSMSQRLSCFGIRPLLAALMQKRLFEPMQRQYEFIGVSQHCVIKVGQTELHRNG
jgi:hypothetical protein